MSSLNTFKKAEDSLLDRPHQVRPSARGRSMKKPVLAIEAVSKLHTVQFFNHILTDEMEARMWMIFITGKAPTLQKVQDEHGDLVDIAVMADVELNPISWAAFKRAVEYKRGQPVVVVKGDDENGKKDSRVIEINVIGATPEYFEKAAKSKGFLTRGNV